MKFMLSRNQFFLLLFIVQTGSSFFSFPAPFVNAAGRDAWLLFIVSAIFHYMLLLFYERNYDYFTMGPFVSWLYKGYWLFVVISYLAYVDYTLAVWGFPKTPQYIVIGILVTVSLYANLSRAETAINLPVLLIPLILAFLGFLQFAWGDVIWTNIFPIGQITGTEWWKGLLKGQTAFIGIELYLVFRSRVDIKQNIKGLPLFVYQMTWFLFFFFSVLLTIWYFTPTGVKLVPEPLLFLLRTQEVTFIERLDLFFLYIWTVWTIVTVTLVSFTALYVHRQHAKEKQVRDTIIWHVLLVVLPLFFLKKENVDYLNDLIIYVHLVFAIIIPVIVIFINRRKRK
ncbi:GerAB/ArcD/ProY family transporter [Sporosarcina sp. HYO08]|uniref:GerAB/ArcD/ProY family transporter n=1 Tax=Sporosarcina sp. HYO08 TaxID=1759557 RepID=UPI000793F444|nr:GerAB/ArcD/ProY family transporter [Sporosarcina sp. HYO08]KXH81778.1 hypothetical protein AU377_05800 [Sporosarcina sp. HYO08]